MLDSSLKAQVTGLVPLITRKVVFAASLDDSERSKKLALLLDEVAALSDKISVEKEDNERTPSFAIRSPGSKASLRFAGVPMGHEFASFMLAMVQVGGHAPKIDDATRAAIEAVEGEHHFVTYMSLSCHNCPEVVQSLNVMALVNPRIHHVAVEGGAFRDEVNARGVKSVPAVFDNGEFFASGRMGIADFLTKLTGDSSAVAARWRDTKPFDVLVAGGGPAGVAAAVYAARKGLRVGVAAERVGGQVLDTAAIENLITVPVTQGPRLGEELRSTAEAVGATVMEPLAATSLSRDGDGFRVACDGGVTLSARSVVIATGAQYRKLGIPGEEEYLTKGVTFCPHCDGPLFKGQDVIVIGGGNSGIEAAIDLAGITRHVTVVEFLPECRADSILMDAARGLDNLDIVTNAAAQKVAGDGKKVTGLVYEDRADASTHTIKAQGIFIQVGLVPRTAWLEGSGVELTKRGEVTVDGRCATSVPGVYAAGDCSTTPYKQIVTAVGSGAVAALSAYEHLALGR